MKPFKETVQAMTIKEIVEAMIRGLEAEHVKVDMYSFGRQEKGVCYGCAATNAVCEIANYVFKPEDFKSFQGFDGEAKALNVSAKFLQHFEDAINDLRSGSLIGYNMYAKKIDIALIPDDKLQVHLPDLEDWNYITNLHYYKDFASTL